MYSIYTLKYRTRTGQKDQVEYLKKNKKNYFVKQKNMARFLFKAFQLSTVLDRIAGFCDHSCMNLQFVFHKRPGSSIENYLFIWYIQACFDEDDNDSSLFPPSIIHNDYFAAAEAICVVFLMD